MGPVGRDVNWDEQTERQVGAAGVRDVRRMLDQSRTAMTARRRQRTSAALLVAGAVAVAGLSVVVGSARPQALPPGVYIATFTEGPVEVVVKDDGSVELDAPASVEVDLEYGDDGEILDAFTVATADGDWAVDVDVDDDGDYAVTTTPVVPSGQGTTPGEPDETSGETPQAPPSPDTPIEDEASPPSASNQGTGDDPPRVGTEDNPGQGHGPDDNPSQDNGREDPPRVGTEENPGQGHGPDDNPGKRNGLEDPPRVGTEDNPGQGHGPDDNPGKGNGLENNPARDGDPGD